MQLERSFQNRLWQWLRSYACLFGAMLLPLLSMGCLEGSSQYIVPPSPELTPVGAAPSELSKIQLPPYVIEPADILLIEVYTEAREKLNPASVIYPQPITGQHLVRPDGTVNLGLWGSVSVSGMTTLQAGDAIRKHVFDRMKNDEYLRAKGTEVDDPNKLFVIVDVLAYNSKAYYVITDGAGYGEQIYRFPVQGSETVIDALSNINGLPIVASKHHIWIARRTPYAGQPDQLLPVDYIGITQHGITLTNYQILPGDRLYVKSEKVFRVDNFLQKFLTPIERVIGGTLLGSSAVNSISGRGLNNTSR